MSTRKERKTATLEQEAIDRRVIAQSNDNSAWEAPIRVKKSTPGVDKWIERVVRERVELEELAFAEAKRKLTS